MFEIFYVISSVAVAFLGRHRKIGALGFFIVSILLTPILALLILILTIDKRVKLESS